MQQDNHKLLRAFAMATNAPLEPGVRYEEGMWTENTRNAKIKGDQI